MLIDEKLQREGFAAIGATFRGEIWEDDAEVPMVNGYSNEGKPFDISTACYLRPVFQAIKNPKYRKGVIQAAVQTLKTFATVERTASYLIKHDPGDMAIYDCDQDAANDHAKSRLMPLLHSVPGIAGQVAEVENRHDITTTEFYLPGMTLRVWPLNESSTQRITLRYVLISDAFLSKKTGLIENAIARTTQHPNDKKIIIESQGSDEGDDFDLQFKSTDMRMLHVKCPLCGEGQPFEFDRERPAEFIPTVKPEFTWEPPKPGTYSGFQRGPDELILLPDGGYNAAEVIRNTYYECYHCGGKWHDVPETRAFLDESSYYVAENPSANPENFGFSWPNWINRRIRWGGDEVMLGYLNAKKSDKEFGNKGPLKIWYQKRAAKTWSDKLTQKKYKVLTGSHNIEGKVPDEVARMMEVDCQQDPDLSAVAGKSIIGTFWYTAYAVDKNGRNIYQLARGFAKSWKEWIDIRKALKIPNKNVAIDGGNWLHEIVEYAAVNWEEGTNYDERGKPFKARVTWTVLRGNGTRSAFRHKDGIDRVYAKESKYQHRVQVGNQTITINVPVVEWSNLAIKDQLLAIRQGAEGKSKWHVLPREALNAQTQEMERGAKTYERQINNEHRTREKGKDIWVEDDPNVHYKDCDCMAIVQCARGGLIGHIEALPEDATEV